MKAPIPDWNTQRRDYWVMRYCRGSSLITVFLVGPFLQIVSTRILPFILIMGVLILLIGHGITRGRYFPIECIKAVCNPSLWSAPQKLVYSCYSLIVIWMIASLLWSPMPYYGVRDIILLVVVLPIVHFVSMEQATNSNREFAGTLVAGIFVASILMILQLKGVTDLLRFTSETARTSDLNRNAVLLTMLCWTPVLFVKNKWQDLVVYFLGILIAGTAVYFSKSEAAKVAFVAAILVGILIKFAPSSARVISFCLALTIVIFPFVLPKIVAVIPMESRIVKQGHAHHRFAIWLGYAQVIQKSPIVGAGIRADRYLGMKGLAPPFDPEKQYDNVVTSPHNFILEIWVNFGATGAFLVALMLLGLGRLACTIKPSQALVSMQLIVVAFVYSSVGSAFLQGWWIVTIAIAMIALLVAHSQSENT